MRNLMLLFSIFISILINANELSYGLRFKSHKYLGAERTALILNDDKPFKLNEETELSFEIKLRNELIFGTVFKIISDTQEVLSISYTADEKNNRYPILLINDNIYPITNKAELDKWIPVNVRLTEKKDSIYLKYGKIEIAVPFTFKDWKNIKISFGVCKFPNFTSSEIPPMDIRDIKIFSNQNLVRHWELKQHTADKCYDKIHQVPAIVVNPQWIIDEHTKWTSLYSKEFPHQTNPQYAFNPRKNIIYIVPDHKSVICYNPTTGKDSTIIVKGGYPAGNSTNQLIYDPVNNKLISYNLDEKTISEFSFSTERWSKETAPEKEHSFWHHTASLNEKDGTIFTFGGYGFYSYKNDLFKINSKKQTWDNDKLVMIPPRYSSASAIVGDQLYIFGGRGSKTGKQELNTHLYYDLYSVNLKSHETKLISQFNEDKQFLPCGNMIYNPADSCFYVLTNWNKGTLFKISLHNPKLEEISSAINQPPIESDYTFYTLFRSESDAKIYALFCKNFKTEHSDISIFGINYPPVPQSYVVQNEPDSSVATIMHSIWIVVSVIVLVVIAFFIYRKRQKTVRFRAMAHTPPPPSEQLYEIKKTFDNTRNCINLLGGFNTIDKNGNDITVNFTPILKNLLLLILLHCENNGKGINNKNIEGILWPDKEEKSARNNRNVSITRLKTLLSEIGDIQLNGNNRFWKITLGKDVICDYYIALDYMRRIQDNPEQKKDILPGLMELLMRGPLLPHTQVDWIDKFKNEYTNHAIDFLNSLLEDKDADDTIKLQLTDAIFLYDSLNEEALNTKCYILYNSGKKGLMKSTYDNFCKEYYTLLGEKYKYSLTQIIEFAAHQSKVKQHKE